MLLNGVNHVAILTHDTDRLQNPDAMPGVHNPPGPPAARYPSQR